MNDCTLLLDYLSRMPDARLDWCFEETRGRASGTRRHGWRRRPPRPTRRRISWRG
ncbi:hypothetical protein ACFQU2_23365 [Siccirubricoccus deserti]